ncbi:MAG: ferritin-like domain-containing protein [Pseudomonadota bacterium]
MSKTLVEAALTVLNASDAAEKAKNSLAAAQGWRDGTITEVGRASPPDRPGRPDEPCLLQPRDMPKRRKAQSQPARIALLHALAHIELNAIDLAWDMVARYADPKAAGMDLPRAFFDDWVKVGTEEATHFSLLSARLEAMGSRYGALPAHDGLWQAATDTADNLAARLAVVPLVLEARGLDVTPAMIKSLNRAGDPESAAILQRIHDDEIGHVAIGKRWFDYVCEQDGLPTIETWQSLVRRYFKGSLKRPFNVTSRDLANFSSAFYEPLADDPVGR